MPLQLGGAMWFFLPKGMWVEIMQITSKQGNEEADVPLPHSLPYLWLDAEGYEGLEEGRATR